MSRAWRFLLAAALAPLAASCNCGCDQPNGEPDAADASLSDRVVDAADSGTADAWRLDPWPPRDACDATQIELPPTGTTVVGQVSHWGKYVVYDDRRNLNSDYRSEVLLYDLSTCTEHYLTTKVLSQLAPSIWDSEVVFVDNQQWEPTIVSEIVSLSLSSLSFSYLTHDNKAFWTKHNGRYIIYKKASDEEAGQSLVLWDRVMDEEVVLAEPSQGAEDQSISETHAAWVAWGGPGKDVYYVELQTRDIVHVESTYDSEVWRAATWGDWVIWQDNRGEKSDVYGLRLSTGEEVRLTDNGAHNQIPQIRGHIACWRTNLWGLATGWDLVVYDLETGVLRRVTEESQLGLRPGYVDSGWLVFEREIDGDYWRKKVYAYDLVAMGLVDEQGHVIPE